MKLLRKEILELYCSHWPFRERFGIHVSSLKFILSEKVCENEFGQLCLEIIVIALRREDPVASVASSRTSSFSDV